jgi:hypothetical protein
MFLRQKVLQDKADQSAGEDGNGDDQGEPLWIHWVFHVKDETTI